ncbi:hypothetical protein FACS1894122_06880 [Alphaproteobacteria bacterium]|nr:hypothetical protein FACS1894122_06880 [Alphaproteobacteria bacterium]
MKNLIYSAIVAVFALVAQFETCAMDGEQWACTDVSADLPIGQLSKTFSIGTDKYAFDYKRGQVLMFAGNAFNPISPSIVDSFNTNEDHYRFCYNGTDVYTLSSVTKKLFVYHFNGNYWQDGGNPIDGMHIHWLCSDGNEIVYGLNRHTGELKKLIGTIGDDAHWAPDVTSAFEAFSLQGGVIPNDFAWPCIDNVGNVYVLASLGADSWLAKFNRITGTWEKFDNTHGGEHSYSDICTNGANVYAIFEGQLVKLIGGNWAPLAAHNPEHFGYIYLGLCAYGNGLLSTAHNTAGVDEGRLVKFSKVTAAAPNDVIVIPDDDVAPEPGAYFAEW